MSRNSDKQPPGRANVRRGAFIYPVGPHFIARGRRRIIKLEQQRKETEEENAGLRDRLLRQMAEFDNYRKRSEREFVSLITNANESLIKEILPVVDDLGRSLSAENNAGDSQSFKEGVRLIYNKFLKMLESQGVQPMKTVGEPFDSEKHEALMQMEREDTPPDIVLEEYERGYTMNDRVIRHAKVIVSK